VDVAKDPDLKKILFKIVVIDDKANHSFFFKRTLKLLAIWFSLDPLRIIQNKTNVENEMICKKVKSWRI